MKISKNYLFLGILYFLSVVNFLIISNTSVFHLEKILIFLFLLVVPGFLITVILRFRNVLFGEYLTLTIGCSTIFLMLTGLLANWVFPLLNYYRPISTLPLLITFDIVFLLAGIIAYFRSVKQYTIRKIKIVSKLNVTFYILPLFFPLLSILGAISLNNNGPNFFTLVSFAAIIVYLTSLAILRDRLSEKLYPWSIYFVALTLIYMGSFRSWHIASTDATLEYGLGNFVLRNGIWDYWQGNNNYYGMLSIVILPTMLSLFLDSTLLAIQKIVFPIIYSFLPLGLYYLFRHLTISNKVAFFGSLFFIAQPTFALWNYLPPRQEIAFLFLGLMYLAFFSKSLSNNAKVFLFTIFGFGVITSHYSTTFILSLIFVMAYMVCLLYMFWKIIRRRRNQFIKAERVRFNIFGFLIIIFLLLEIVWYFAVTDIGFKAANLAESKLTTHAFSFERSPLNFIAKQLPVSPEDDLKNYVAKVKSMGITSYSDEFLNRYPQKITPTSEITRVNNFEQLSRFTEIIKIALLLIGFLSTVFGILVYWKNKAEIDKIFLFLGGSSIVLLSLLVQFPFVGGYYDPIRLYQQLLIGLSIFSVFTFLWLLRRRKKALAIVYTVFTLLYLLFLTHVPYNFIGGNRVQLNLANVGKDYEFSYTKTSEIKAIDWLMENNTEKELMVLDNYAQFKLYQSKYYSLDGNVKLEVLPSAINKDDYVYATRANIKQGITFKYADSGLLIYNYPIEFLNENKDAIYSNGQSTIYK